MDVVKLIVPVEAFANTNPNGDALNVPPNWAMEGEGFAPPKQYAAAEYANVELPAAVKITVCMVDEGQEPPNEYCTKYEPGWLNARLISPVDVLAKTNPGFCTEK